MEQRIPKIIHYCWFGYNPKPELVLKCIESWKRFCPDYEIKEWNENSFDVDGNAFTREAYLAKKWAFVSDYVRGYALLNYGGVYLDTDMELLKPLDPLLVNPFFAGFEVNDSLASCVIGSNAEYEIIRQYWDYYQGKHFQENGKIIITTSPIVLTDILKKQGLELNGKKQCVNNCMIYPRTAFSPTSLQWVIGKYSSKTIGIHHFMDSWGKNTGLGERSRYSKLRLCMLFFARNLFGTRTMYELGQRIRKIKE